MTPRSKVTKIKRLERQQLKHMANPKIFKNLELRIQTLQNTKRR